MIKIETITQAATITLPANDYYQLVQVVKDAEKALTEILESMKLRVDLEGTYKSIRVPTPSIPKTLEQRIIDQTVDALLQNREALAFLVENKKHYFNTYDGAFDDWDYSDTKVDLLGIERLKDRWHEVELDLLFPVADVQDDETVVDDSAKEEL